MICNVCNSSMEQYGNMYTCSYCGHYLIKKQIGNVQDVTQEWKEKQKARIITPSFPDPGSSLREPKP
jgi:tRNA(Ile2) C34 agmatinyltransferase TiaS